LTVRAATTLDLLTADIGATTGDSSRILIKTGDAGTVGAGSSGHLYLALGTPNGAGLKGNIGLLTSSVSNWQSMQNGLFMADALVAPTGNPTGGAFFYTDPTTHKPMWRVPAGTTYDLSATGAGAFAITETEIDFGSNTQEEYDTTLFVADTSITGTSKIIVCISAKATADHTLEDVTSTTIVVFAGNVAAGSGFTIYAKATEGTYGKYKVNYTVVY
jgi:hypothetical protein